MAETVDRAADTTACTESRPVSLDLVTVVGVSRVLAKRQPWPAKPTGTLEEIQEVGTSWDEEVDASRCTCVPARPVEEAAVHAHG
ncbi:MAG TPA: hypothetical protein VHC41_01360 [Mycobacteriales bacterium]|nr:hypothetical protein [Mycobacteriales bacterium]